MIAILVHQWHILDGCAIYGHDEVAYRQNGFATVETHFLTPQDHFDALLGGGRGHLFVLALSRIRTRVRPI
jgi:hypothetical protein